MGDKDGLGERWKDLDGPYCTCRLQHLEHLRVHGRVGAMLQHLEHLRVRGRVVALAHTCEGHRTCNETVV